jgi:hypothetical protein
LVRNPGASLTAKRQEGRRGGKADAERREG